MFIRSDQSFKDTPSFLYHSSLSQISLGELSNNNADVPHVIPPVLGPGTSRYALNSWFGALAAGLAVKTAKPLCYRLAVRLEHNSLPTVC